MDSLPLLCKLFLCTVLVVAKQGLKSWWFVGCVTDGHQLFICFAVVVDCVCPNPQHCRMSRQSSPPVCFRHRHSFMMMIITVLYLRTITCTTVLVQYVKRSEYGGRSFSSLTVGTINYSTTVLLLTHLSFRKSIDFTDNNYYLSTMYSKRTRKYHTVVNDFCEAEEQRKEGLFSLLQLRLTRLSAARSDLGLVHAGTAARLSHTWNSNLPPQSLSTPRLQILIPKTNRRLVQLSGNFC